MRSKEVTALLLPPMLLLLLFLFPLSLASALTLTVSGGFGFVVDHTDIPAGAGGEPEPTHASSDNAVILDVGESGGASDAWEIQVRLEDTLWHGGLALKVLRTGSGTGPVTGGDILPLELTATDQPFFEGTGDNSGIEVKLILDNVSVLIPADTYSGVVHFTLVDIP